MIAKEKKKKGGKEKRGGENEEIEGKRDKTQKERKKK